MSKTVLDILSDHYHVKKSLDLLNKGLLKDWKNEEAYRYAKKLILELGVPDGVMEGKVYWENKAQFDSVYVLDESVKHSWPKEHTDFVYSTKKIDVPVEFQLLLPIASESIMYDALKNQATARCGTLYANAVTLGFIEDLVAGNINPKEVHLKYAEYIKQGKLPSWYKNELKE